MDSSSRINSRIELRFWVRRTNIETSNLRHDNPDKHRFSAFEKPFPLRAKPRFNVVLICITNSIYPLKPLNRATSCKVPSNVCPKGRTRPKIWYTNIVTRDPTNFVQRYRYGYQQTSPDQDHATLHDLLNTFINVQYQCLLHFREASDH